MICIIRLNTDDRSSMFILVEKYKQMYMRTTRIITKCSWKRKQYIIVYNNNNMLCNIINSISLGHRKKLIVVDIKIYAYTYTRINMKYLLSELRHVKHRSITIKVIERKYSRRNAFFK